MILVATGLGRVTAWLARLYRAATPFERVLILPVWAVFRGLFLVSFKFAGG